MKRLMIFIGLKVIEIGGAVFGGFYLGRWNPFGLMIEIDGKVGHIEWVEVLDCWQGYFWTWMAGLVHLTIVILVGMILFGIVALIRQNWQLAGYIGGKK